MASLGAPSAVYQYGPLSTLRKACRGALCAPSQCWVDAVPFPGEEGCEGFEVKVKAPTCGLEREDGEVINHTVQGMAVTLEGDLPRGLERVVPTE